METLYYNNGTMRVNRLAGDTRTRLKFFANSTSVFFNNLENYWKSSKTTPTKVPTIHNFQPTTFHDAILLVEITADRAG